MLMCPDNVRQEIVKSVPSSELNEICCFAFYDNHPLDSKKLDITICTSREVKEYYQREVVCSLGFDLTSVPREIRILRNSNNDLFYLVMFEDEIVIMRRTNTLQIHKQIKYVKSFDVNDSACRGQAYLKVFCKGDAVPLIFDDNFESLGDGALVLSQLSSCDTLPLMVDLKRKLSEAKYNIKCLEKSYSELTKMRQNLAFSSYKKLNSNNEGSLYQCNSSVEGALQLKTHKPWVNFSNKAIIVIVEVLNKSTVPVENVHMLLHRTAKSAVVYTTKLFEKSAELPYWRELQSKNITTACKSAVIAVIDWKELKNCVTSKVAFNVVICYTIDGIKYLLPVEDVSISAMDSMGEHFDALSNLREDVVENQYALLAILASSVKIDLCLKHIKNDDEPDLNIKNLFCEYLGMELLISSLVVHRSSPYHILHGVMVNCTNSNDVSVYARSSCQVLALIHYIHDAVPHRIVVTTPKQMITAKIDELSIYNDEELRKCSPETGLFEYGRTIVNQSTLVLDYLDKCMIKMNESKNPTVQLKVGSEIDVFADDVSGFLDFKRRMLQEASKDGEAVRIYPTIKLVDNYNNAMLSKLTSKLYVMNARDESKEPATYGQKPSASSIPVDPNNTGGLVSVISMGIGTRVMLRMNIRVSEGLVNGSMGVVRGFEWEGLRREQLEEGELPKKILIDFDDKTIGQSFKNTNGWVGICPMSVTFQGTRGYGKIERVMVPLILSWAVTVHKLQGTTVDKAVVCLGNKMFAKGQAYVALSRVRSLDGVVICDLDQRKLFNNPHNNVALQELERLRNITQ